MEIIRRYYASLCDFKKGIGTEESVETIKKLMNNRKVDMLFTDPPYNMSFNGRSGNFDVIENDSLSENEFNIFINR